MAVDRRRGGSASEAAAAGRDGRPVGARETPTAERTTRSGGAADSHGSTGPEDVAGQPGQGGSGQGAGRRAPDGSGAAAASGGSEGGGTRPVPVLVVPPRDWGQLLLRAWKRAVEHQASLLGAGVAFYAFLSVFPAITATLAIYGLVADPDRVVEQLNVSAAGLPEAAQPLVREQIAALAGVGQGALTLSLVVSLSLALWSASTATAGLMRALNVLYDRTEHRGFVPLRATAFALTLGGILFVLVALTLVAAVPVVLNIVGATGGTRLAVQLARWSVLLLAVLGALGVAYRFGPVRGEAGVRWITPGALVATILLGLVSALFSLYANNFGSYQDVYGALAGAVVLMLWLSLGSFAVLLGGSVNAQAERWALPPAGWPAAESDGKNGSGGLVARVRRLLPGSS